MKDVVMRTTYLGVGIVQKVHDNYSNNVYFGQTLTVLLKDKIIELESYTCTSIQ